MIGAKTFRNWVSLTGAAVALITFLMILVLLILTMFLGEGGLYLGLVIYILLPAVMLGGLLLIPIGMFLRSRRIKRHRPDEIPAWPRIDLGDPRQRRRLLMFSVGATVFLLISVIGSYEAFHYTESVPFCGRLCHTVMKPEYVAYQNSPHARVSCVACHVGEGADWYVRSKLSGLYQVYATVFNKYPVPIPTPIENLRPARETCEQCHWPEKFYAHKQRFETYFLSDEENSEWHLRLTIKTGPEHQAMGLKEGIHWHINPDVRVEYIAGDERRESIPWVRYTDLKTGRQVVYQDGEAPLDPKELDALEPRTMDCIDCHNRPSHDYGAPFRLVNAALTSGELPDLPGIKATALTIFDMDFETEAEAVERIRDVVEKEYADAAGVSADLRRRAADTLTNLFTRNVFPEMKVRWDMHLNHIGHMHTDGCFRCHNATHAGESGEFIRRDCNLCHFITAQGPPGELEVRIEREPLPFRHPADIAEMWREMLCSECHTGSGM